MLATPNRIAKIEGCPILDVRSREEIKIGVLNAHWIMLPNLVTVLS